MDCTPSANGSRPTAPPDVIAPWADEKSADLARMKAIATGLLAASVLLAILARALEPRHWAFSYVAAWAEAAAVGGLADWYAIVALFRHPLGIPMPHTAIIASNRTRVAESFGAFVHDQFLQPEPIGEKLRSSILLRSPQNGSPTISAASPCRDSFSSSRRKRSKRSRRPVSRTTSLDARSRK